LEAVYTGDIPYENFQRLTSTIKILGDNEEVESFQYEAKPIGQASEPVSGSLSF
jgi:hypothetical protein